MADTELPASAPVPPPLEAPGRRRGRRHQRTTWADWVLFGLLLLVVGWVLVQAVPLLRADLTMLQARWYVMSWADGTSRWTLRSWIRSRDDLTAALAITPNNPSIHDQLATLYLIRARDSAFNGEVQRDLFQQAEKHQLASLGLRPDHGWTLAALAETRQALRPGTDEVWSTWRQARTRAPHERSVTWALLRTTLSGWAAAPEDVRQWAIDFRNSSLPNAMKAVDALAAQHGLSLAPESTDTPVPMTPPAPVAASAPVS